MKKKKLLLAILGGLVGVAAVTGVVLLLLNNNDDEPKKPKKVECENITGGSYNLVFNTNGGDAIENVSVCIACPPNSYEELPVAKKDGSVFAGWYYDEKLTDAVSAQTSMDIKPVEKKDKNGCVEGYQDITLYAKWDKEVAKTLKVTFDANGGSKVNTVEFTCGSDNSAKLSKLPSTTKNGYTFVAWVDKHENPILVGAKIICGSDLKLKATWEKIEDNNVPEDDNKQISYKCDDGWKLAGKNCVRTSSTDTVNASYACKDDEVLIEKMCVKLKGVTDEQMKSYTVKTCNQISMYVGHGGPKQIDGVLFPDGVTCFYKEEPDFTKDACTEKGYKWNSDKNMCYRETRTGNTTVTCKSDDYYYVATPNNYDGIHNLNGGCYPKKSAELTCPSGYAKITSRSGMMKCGKVETKAATKVEK